METYLIYLAYFTILLLLGLLCSITAKKTKTPDIFLLILVGILIGNILPIFSSKAESVIEASKQSSLLPAIAVLTLALIVFDGASRFKYREFDDFSFRVLKLTIIFLMPYNFKFDLNYFFIALVFATVMSGTDPSSVIKTMGETTRKNINKVIETLKIESLINTPLVVLLPFIVLDLKENLIGTKLIAEKIIEQIYPFLTQFVTGIGAGVLIGIIVFKFMRKQYAEKISPLALVVTALLTYVLAEVLEGNGVLAVTTLGLLFGNIYIKQKEELQEFSALFTKFLEMFVFILVGLLIVIPRDTLFLINSLILFFIYVAIRFISVNVALKKEDYNLKEKIFMTLNMPKGIAVAVVAFVFASIGGPLIDLILVFMVYSIVLSTVVTKFSRYFIRVKIIK